MDIQQSQLRNSNKGEINEYRQLKQTMGQGIKVSGWGVPEDVDIRFSKNNSGKLSPDKITSLSVIKGKGLQDSEYPKIKIQKAPSQGGQTLLKHHAFKNTESIIGNPEPHQFKKGNKDQLHRGESEIQIRTSINKTSNIKGKIADLKFQSFDEQIIFSGGQKIFNS